MFKTGVIPTENDGGVMTDGERVYRKGQIHPEQFCSATGRLQKDGFVTELWMSKKGMLMLRWVNDTSQWHVSARKTATTTILEQLETVGRNAVRWLEARASGHGNEANFAVREA